MSKSKDIKLPGVGRVGVYHEKASQGVGFIGNSTFKTNLTAQVIRGGKKDANGQLIPGTGRVLEARETMSWLSRFWGNIKGGDKVLDLGSGLVTNVGVTAMANEAVTLASPSGARINTLFLANNHISGTGATAAAATDITLQTISTHGGQTPQAGAQSFVSAANAQKYQTVATISYSGNEAVTEWGLITSSTVSATTGSPLTAATSASATVTATPLTASSSTVQGQQQHIIATGTTAVYGFIISNTTSVLTIPAWYKVADGTAGSTPGNTETYILYPVLFDHKVFSAINVTSVDSIAFTYVLTVNSGG